MRKIGVLLVIALLLALAPAVLAGGWAVVTLDDAPGEIRAGEPWAIGFTVLQHGQTPVHEVFEGEPVEPALVATHVATGQRVVADAAPSKEVGHFTVEVTFPSDGEWEWTIFTAPLESETEFAPLTVLPAEALVAPDGAVAPAAGVAPAVEVAPAAALDEPVMNDSPVEVAAPLAVTTTESESSTTIPALLRWGALIVALAAVALFVIQNRRRAQPAGIES